MRFLLFISKTYSIPILQPLVQYLDAVSNHSYIIYVTENVYTLITEKKIWNDKNITTSLKEATGFNPDFCLSPGNFIDYRLPGIKVGLFHGIGIEKESHYKIRHIYDVYLTSGPVVTERFKKLRAKHRYFLVRETGWLKVDHILNFSADNLREQFGFPAGKRIILYAPTFSNKLESGSTILNIIPQIKKDDEIWLIKPHELMNNRVLKFLSTDKNDSIHLIKDYDITPYLHLADVMISDTSSVVYEFMLLDKPVITYRTIARKDKGIDITHPNRLRDALDRALEHPDENSQTRHRHIKEVNPYLDGKTSQRTITTLERIREFNQLPNIKKSLNFRRKIKSLLREVKAGG